MLKIYLYYLVLAQNLLNREYYQPVYLYVYKYWDAYKTFSFFDKVFIRVLWFSFSFNRKNAEDSSESSLVNGEYINTESAVTHL